jgi:hypothetical protein
MNPANPIFSNTSHTHRRRYGSPTPPLARGRSQPIQSQNQTQPTTTTQPLSVQILEQEDPIFPYLRSINLMIPISSGQMNHVISLGSMVRKYGTFPIYRITARLCLSSNSVDFSEATDRIKNIHYNSISYEVRNSIRTESQSSFNMEPVNVYRQIDSNISMNLNSSDELTLNLTTRGTLDGVLYIRGTIKMELF